MARARSMRHSTSGAVSFVRRTAKSSSNTVHGILGRVQWLEALFFGLFGYLLGPALTNLGLPQALAARSPTYANLVDSLYTATGRTSTSPWQAWGASGWVKVGGLGLFGKALYDYHKSGRLSNSALNSTIPFALGAMFDPPGGGEAAGGSWGSGAGPGGNW